MALQLQKQIDNIGVSVEYWKMSKVVFDYIANRGYFVLTPYLNQDAREDGKNNITGMDVRFDIESMEEVRPALYEIAKTSRKIIDEDGNEVETNEFANSTDC